MRMRVYVCDFSVKTSVACTAALFLVAFSLVGCAGVAQQSTSTPSSPEIVVTPNSITFSNVIVGQKSSQTVQILNNGKADLNVTGISITGSGFSLSSIAVPFQLTPGVSKTFTVTFTASNTTTAKATLTITSDAPTSPMSVAIQGTGETTSAAWQMNPTSLSFANIAVQTSQTFPATIKNTGNVAVSISSVKISNQEWSTSGLTSGTNLGPGQQVSFNVTFRPTVVGAASGTITVASSSTGASALTMNVTGGGSAPPPSSSQHTVTLDWNPSASAVAGYHVYRGTSSGGPYSLLNVSLDSATSYVDSTVASGSKYFYVTTAVDTSGSESNFSNEVSATIPNP